MTEYRKGKHGTSSRKAQADQDEPVGVGSLAHIRAQAIQLSSYLRKWEMHTGSWPVIRSLTIYPPTQNRTGSWLVVLKGFAPEKRLVAFHRATTPFAAMVGILQKWIEGSLVWKVDTYRERDPFD